MAFDFPQPLETCFSSSGFFIAGKQVRKLQVFPIYLMFRPDMAFILQTIETYLKKRVQKKEFFMPE